MRPNLTFLVFLGTILSSSAYDMARLNPVYESCKLNFPNIQTFPTIEQMTSINFETADPQIKCFIHCLSESTGEVDANGVLVTSGLLAMGWSDEGKVSSAVNECIGIKGIDKCDTSYQQYGCFMMKMM
uniref:CSON008397 protein n=1 Tax=Culicoides sonorensis TaxID=179676 RepID=A0A336LBV8_CULSO